MEEVESTPPMCTDEMFYIVSPQLVVESSPCPAEQTFRSVEDALLVLRKQGAESKRISFSAGVHFLNKTLELGPKDANIIFEGPPGSSGKTAWLSGGQPLTGIDKLWKPYDTKVLW